MVLSEIGVNTAPLLASAGIIGVAIGFGSQKLVQDLITGLFLLLENAMQVGDVVTVSAACRARWSTCRCAPSGCAPGTGRCTSFRSVR